MLSNYCKKLAEDQRREKTSEKRSVPPSQKKEINTMSTPNWWLWKKGAHRVSGCVQKYASSYVFEEDSDDVVTLTDSDSEDPNDSNEGKLETDVQQLPPGPWCGACMARAVEPTVLQCGHTFCARCLSKLGQVLQRDFQESQGQPRRLLYCPLANCASRRRCNTMFPCKLLLDGSVRFHTDFSQAPKRPPRCQHRHCVIKENRIHSTGSHMFSCDDNDNHNNENCNQDGSRSSSSNNYNNRVNNSSNKHSDQLDHDDNHNFHNFIDDYESFLIKSLNSRMAETTIHDGEKGGAFLKVKDNLCASGFIQRSDQQDFLCNRVSSSRKDNTTAENKVTSNVKTFQGPLPKPISKLSKNNGMNKIVYSKDNKIRKVKAF